MSNNISFDKMEYGNLITRNKNKQIMDNYFLCNFDKEILFTRINNLYGTYMYNINLLHVQIEASKLRLALSNICANVISRGISFFIDECLDLSLLNNFLCHEYEVIPLHDWSIELFNFMENMVYQLNNDKMENIGNMIENVNLDKI